MEASSKPQTLVVTGAKDTIEYENVLVGDLWICGGQSNMELSLGWIYHSDVELASANFPGVRLMTLPEGATPTLQKNFSREDTGEGEKKGVWCVCSPGSLPVRHFSAIGYIFGRRLHMASRIPIGLIDTSVGGTVVEACASREALESVGDAAPLLKDWDEKIAAWDAKKDLARRLEEWKKRNERLKAEGKNPWKKPAGGFDLLPGPAYDRNNPSASYNAMVGVFAGFAVKGAIWNQGYQNAGFNARPALYTKTFQAMIRDWRRTFRDDKMPFGIVEFGGGAEPQTMDNFELRMVDAAPYIREAQFQAYKDLEGIGWACAYDQQVNFFHPFRKLMLGERIARWALATQYGVKLGHEPAICTNSEIAGDRIILTFDRGVKVDDGRPIEGMAIAGADKLFYPAQARRVVIGKDSRNQDVVDCMRVEVWCEHVPEPKAVRYAWARNPLGNLVNSEHLERVLPVPSFRTDKWGWEDAPCGSGSDAIARGRYAKAMGQARQQNRKRKLLDAKARVKELQDAEGKEKK